jgi:hypothetical protein
MIDYIDLMPSPPPTEDEKRLYDSMREMMDRFVKDHEITFVTPKAPPFSGGTRYSEILSWVGAGEQSGRSNVMMFEMLKPRNAGKTIVYFDYEASFTPDQLMVIGVDQLNLDK